MTVEEMKIYCKENNEKLYHISIYLTFDTPEYYCFGKPIYNEKVNIVEFINIETKKEIIFRVGNNSCFLIEEL